MPRSRRSAAAGSDTQTTTSAPPSQRRSRRRRARRWARVGNSGRRGSKVQASRTSATQGTPRLRSAIPTAWADSGGEVVITQSNGRRRWSAERLAPGEWRPRQGERLGHDHPAEEVGASRVGVGVEHGVHGVLAGPPRAPQVGVGGAVDGGVAVVSVGGRREDLDVVPKPAQVLRHRRGPQRARVGAGRVEVRDEEDPAGGHRRALRLAGFDRLGVDGVHALDQAPASSIPSQPWLARRRPSAPASAASATSRSSAAATAPGVAQRHDQPGVAIVHHRTHARVVAGDGRQAAGHRLDQDDAERLRRLGGEQEEVRGAQHAREIGVAEPRRGSGPARRRRP